MNMLCLSVVLLIDTGFTGFTDKAISQKRATVRLRMDTSSLRQSLPGTVELHLCYLIV
jgi:predicted aspartyl protease